MATPTIPTVDITDVYYSFCVFDPNTNIETNISGFLTQLSWGEQQGEFACSLQAEIRLDDMHKTGANQIATALSAGGSPSTIYDLLANGAKVRLYATWGEGFQTVFQGTIFHRVYTNDNGVDRVNIVAYDDLIFLQKSQQTYLFSIYTPANLIIRKILHDWINPSDQPNWNPATMGQSNQGWFSARVGAIDNPQQLIYQTQYRNMSLAEIITNVLLWAFSRGHPASSDNDMRDQWFLRLDDGVIDSHFPGDNPLVYQITSERSVITMSDDASIEDIITEIGVVPSTSNSVAPAGGLGGIQIQPGDPIESYPHAIYVTPNTDLLKVGRIRMEIQPGAGDVQTRLIDYVSDIFKIRSQEWRIRKLTAPDLPFLRRGHALRVKAGSMGNINPDGTGDDYIVTSITHDATTRTMNVVFDSTGILGRRVQQQQFQLAFAGASDDAITESIRKQREAGAPPEATTVFDPYTGGVTPGAMDDAINQVQAASKNPPQSQNTPSAGFKPDTPTVPQSNSWYCSAGSLAWMLNSVGGDYTDISAGKIMEQQGQLSGAGLSLASGAGITKMLTGGAFDGKIYNAANGPVSWDQVVNEAGHNPIMIGSNGWYPGQGHWSGVRGVSADGQTLYLANPASNTRAGGTDSTTMTKAFFDSHGDWSGAWIQADPNKA